MGTKAQVKSQAKAPAAPAAARVPQPAAAAPEHEAERPDIATQLETASSLGHSFAALGVGGVEPPPIQPKLLIGSVGDRYEREADRVAERVVSGQPATLPLGELGTLPFDELGVQREKQEEDEEKQIQREPLIQRQAGDGSFEAESNFESRLNRATGGGTPLPPDLRAEFEPRLGVDFSGVRLHTGSESAELNRQVQARAFTYGNDIHFNVGQYHPGSRAGKTLLVHELTHIVQQDRLIQRGRDAGRVQREYDRAASQTEVNRKRLEIALREPGTTKEQVESILESLYPSKQDQLAFVRHFLEKPRSTLKPESKEILKRVEESLSKQAPGAPGPAEAPVAAADEIGDLLAPLAELDARFSEVRVDQPKVSLEETMEASGKVLGVIATLNDRFSDAPGYKDAKAKAEEVLATIWKYMEVVQTETSYSRLSEDEIKTFDVIIDWGTYLAEEPDDAKERFAKVLGIKSAMQGVGIASDVAKASSASGKVAKQQIAQHVEPSSELGEAVRKDLQDNTITAERLLQGMEEESIKAKDCAQTGKVTDALVHVYKMDTLLEEFSVLELIPGLSEAKHAFKAGLNARNIRNLRKALKELEEKHNISVPTTRGKGPKVVSGPATQEALPSELKTRLALAVIDLTKHTAALAADVVSYFAPGTATPAKAGIFIAAAAAKAKVSHDKDPQKQRKMYVELERTLREMGGIPTDKLPTDVDVERLRVVAHQLKDLNISEAMALALPEERRSNKLTKWQQVKAKLAHSPAK